MKRLIQCEEWSKLRVGDGLDLRSIDELGSILTSWKSRTGENPDAYFEILPQALIPKFWTGTIETASLILEVSPIGANSLSPEMKSRLDNNLTGMLATSLSTNSIAAGTASLSVDGSRFEALLDVFCNELQIARRQKIIRSYVTANDSLASPRGKISFPTQCYESIRRPARFASTWVALTEDVPENRIFKQVLLRYKPQCSTRIRSKIDYCLSELDSVDASHDHRNEWPKIRADRLPKIYHSLLQQSKILLDDMGSGFFYGDNIATSEIIFTSRLFERFVSNEVILASSSSNLVTKSQSRGHFACENNDGNGVFELIPDIRLIDYDGKTSLIIDAKWKYLDMQKRHFGISRNDIYQVLTYGAHFNCKDIVLLYPDITTETGESGCIKCFYSILNGYKHSLYIVKIPLISPNLLAARELIRTLITERDKLKIECLEMA